MVKQFLTFDTRELRATALLMKNMEQKARTQVNAQSRKVIQPIWAEAVRKGAKTRAEEKILAGDTSVRMRAWGVVLRAGNKAKVFADGTDLAQAVEFGANRYLINEVRDRHGTFKRHTQRQFTGYRKEGPVWRAVAEVVPRVLALWIQTSIRTVYEQIGR